MGLFDFLKKKRIDETVNQSTKVEKTAKQTTQFEEKEDSKNAINEQLPDSGGFQRVTVHYRFDAGSAGQVITFSQGSMSTEELAQLVDRISDHNLASRIKRYMRNYKIVVERRTDMKRFKSQQDFVGYVSKEFPGCQDAAVVENQMAFYLIAAESGQPDKSMLL